MPVSEILVNIAGGLTGMSGDVSKSEISLSRELLAEIGVNIQDASGFINGPELLARVQKALSETTQSAPALQPTTPTSKKKA